MYKLTSNKIFLSILLSIITVLFGITIGLIIINLTSGISGINEFFDAIYSATFKGLFSGNTRSFSNWIFASIPLILCAFSVAFAYRVGLFNIGAEGQFIVANFVAAILGHYLDFTGSVLICIIISVTCAMLYAAIPGVLKAYLGISEVVVTIMLNWIAFILVNRYFITEIFNDGNLRTPKISQNSSLDLTFIDNIFKIDNSDIFIGFTLTVIVAVIYSFVLNKTTYGYELQSVGFSPFSAAYAGIKSKQKIVSSMMISGAFAGLAGAIYALSSPGFTHVIREFRNYGFDGIAIAMLGQLSSIGIFISGMLFSSLRQAENYLFNIQPEIIDIIVAIILVSSAFTVIFKTKIFKKISNKTIEKGDYK